MNCGKIKLLIESLADGVVTARQRNLIDEHIKDCSGCADYFNFISKLQSAVPPAIYKSSTETKPLIMEKISRIKTDAGLPLLRYIPIMASAAVVLLSLSILHFRPAKTIEVAFVFESNEARTVALAGDFNNWSKDAAHLARENGLWKVTLSLKPGRYQYAFVVDGKKFVPDAKKPVVDDGFGNKNSIMDLARI